MIVNEETLYQARKRHSLQHHPHRTHRYTTDNSTFVEQIRSFNPVIGVPIHVGEITVCQEQHQFLTGTLQYRKYHGHPGSVLRKRMGTSPEKARNFVVWMRTMGRQKLHGFHLPEHCRQNTSYLFARYKAHGIYRFRSLVYDSIDAIW